MDLKASAAYYAHAAADVTIAAVAALMVLALLPLHFLIIGVKALLPSPESAISLRPRGLRSGQ